MEEFNKYTVGILHYALDLIRKLGAFGELQKIVHEEFHHPFLDQCLEQLKDFNEKIDEEVKKL